MNPAERLERLEAALVRLREAAAGATLVVEGRNDVAALEALGVGGTHVLVHRGRRLPDLVERLAVARPPVILLLDWDRTGGRLFATLRDQLVGRIAVDGERRRELASACHCRCIEDVPAELAALRSGRLV